MFQSQEEVIGQEGAHLHPTGESEDVYRALHDISREISLEFSAGGTEESMKSKWTQWERDAHTTQGPLENPMAWRTQIWPAGILQFPVSL